FSGATSFSSSNSLTASTTKNIVFNTGADVSTSDGGITLNANTAGTATGNFIGIGFYNSTLSTSGTGNISLTGTGGSSGGNGINIATGSHVDSLGSGTITITGTGGTGASVNYGVNMDDSGTRVTSVTGAISIEGTGGGDGTGDQN